jgi:hypothetical protein
MDCSAVYEAKNTLLYTVSITWSPVTPGTVIHTLVESMKTKGLMNPYVGPCTETGLRDGSSSVQNMRILRCLVIRETLEDQAMGSSLSIIKSQ